MYEYICYICYIYEYVTRSSDSSQNWLWNHSTKTYGVVHLELREFFLLALDGVKGQLHDPAAFLSDKRHRYTFDARAGGAPQPVFTLWNTENLLACREPNPDSSVVQPGSLCVCLVRGYNCVYICVMQVPWFVSEHRRCRGMSRQMEAFHAIKLPCSGMR